MEMISVIIPFYHGNQFLKGIADQMEANVNLIRRKNIDVSVELILVNDSPDIAVEQSALERGAWEVRVINHSENKGIQEARLTGLRASKGQYILFLDQDDEISSCFLGSQYRRIKKADVVVANAWLEQEDGSRKKMYETRYEMNRVKDIRYYIYSRNQIVSPGQCLIRKSSIPKEWMDFSIGKNGSDDLLLWILLLAKKRSFVLNEHMLYTHKHTGNNLSKYEVEMSKSSLEFAEYLKTIPELDEKLAAVFYNSRTLNISMNQAGFLEKTGLVLKNIRPILLRAFWKGEVIYYRRHSEKDFCVK